MSTQNWGSRAPSTYAPSNDTLNMSGHGNSIHNTSGGNNTMNHPKGVGPFGAPRLRCTESVLALTTALIGLIFVGIGVCLSLFFDHEELLTIPKYGLDGAGTLMIIGGIGYYIYDSCRPAPNQNRQGAYEMSTSTTVNTIAADPPPAYNTVIQQPTAPAPPQQLSVQQQAFGRPQQQPVQYSAPSHFMHQPPQAPSTYGAPSMNQTSV